jgi:CsbD-like
VKGKIKEVAGKLSDNPKLQAEGTVEKISGKVQEKIGQVKKVLGSSESGVSYSGAFLCPRLRLHDTP